MPTDTHEPDVQEQKICTFEVNSHTVAQLISKIKKFIENKPMAKTDLTELAKRIEELASSTFAIRKGYEEDIIHFHMAQKKLVRIF